jgi:hypothetical protein
MLAPAAFLLSTLVLLGPSHGGAFQEGAERREPSRIVIAAGLVNVIDQTPHSVAGIVLRFRELDWDVVPEIGFTASSQGDYVAHAGFRLAWDLSERWALSPGLALSYFESGGGIELGGPFEFRSSIEVSYRLSPRSQIGLELAHLSNAGIYDRNPGGETLVLTWSYALGG